MSQTALCSSSDRVRELVNSGANQIEVSLDAHSPATFARLGKGLDFAAVTRNVRELLRQRETVEIVVRYLRLAVNLDEEPSFVAHWKSLGARVRFLSPTNRAGWLPGLAGFRRTGKRSLFTPVKDVLKRMNPPCMDPFYKLNVLVDGRVILCCHDWGPTETLATFHDRACGKSGAARKCSTIAACCSKGNGAKALSAGTARMSVSLACRLRKATVFPRDPMLGNPDDRCRPFRGRQ